MKKFEYLKETSNSFPLSEGQLNVLGYEGWELTSVIIEPNNNGLKNKFHYYFKKELK